MKLANSLTAFQWSGPLAMPDGVKMMGVAEKQGVAFSAAGWREARLDRTVDADALGRAIRRQLRPLSAPTLAAARDGYARKEVPDLPPYLIIEPVGGACPRKCGFCSINVTHRPLPDGRQARAGMMKWDGYVKLMREFGEWGGGYGVSLYELGETGLWRGKDAAGNKKDWADLVDCAKRVGRFKIANMSTSGDCDNLHRLLECDLDDLIFSIDGLDKRTYETNRPSTLPNDTQSFERTIERVMAFLELKAARGTPRPFVRMQIINNALCAPQVHDFIRHWIAVPGVDDVFVKHLDSMAAWIKGLVTDEEDALKAAQVGEMPCQHIWEVASVTWTGAYNGCSHDARTELYDGHTIYNSTFREWWQGRFMNDLRLEHIGGAKREPCVSCRDRDCWLG
jgi:hypothetical protein